MQSGGPALGPVQQRGHIVGGQRQAVPGHKGRRLLAGEREIRRAYLGDLIGGAQAVQRQRGFRSADDDHPNPCRRVPEQIGQLPKDPRVVDRLEVVEDQHRPVRQVAQPGGEAVPTLSLVRGD
jgi:hypothetical protein